MLTITKEFITNSLSREHRPCATARSGETVVFETYDCFTNQFLPEEATFENVVRKPGNPATGPLYIEGAQPGDMLRVEILDIELGPVGIVMADAMLGEITPTMAAAVASNDAKLILIPMSKCHATIVGVESRRLGEYIAEAVDEIAENCF